MKTHWLLSALLFFSVPLLSQSLTVDSASISASICYNDGSASLHVSGGTEPYSFSIINGPVLPNVTYPFLSDSANRFVNLHAGTYTVLVTDNTGQTLQYPITIPGTYQFPHLTYTVQTDSIIATPTLGLPPYRFCLSSVSPNGPFGPLQSSPVFAALCTGTYYLRVVDSCGNFYTTAAIELVQEDLITYVGCTSQGASDKLTVNISAMYPGNPPFSYYLYTAGYADSNTNGQFVLPPGIQCPDTIHTVDRCRANTAAVVDCHPMYAIFCSNFSDSSFVITPVGGIPPYTYRLYEFDSVTGDRILMHQQDSGTFLHIPYPDINMVILGEVTDACGRSAASWDLYLDFITTNDCPFNGKLYILPGAGTLGPDTGWSITCLNCNPPQTINGQEGYFSNLDTGTYTIRFTDGCGETSEKTVHIPDTLSIKMMAEFISCNDIKVTALSTDHIPLTTGATYSLHALWGGRDTILATNSTGYFFDLPTSLYTIIIQYNGCYDATGSIYVPHLQGYCISPYFDTLCKPMMLITYAGGSIPENYTLTDTGGVVYHEIPGRPFNLIQFDVPPGNYVLSSDSGCSANQQFNHPHFLQQWHTTNCINIGSIKLYEIYDNASGCLSIDSFFFTLENSSGTIISQIPPAAFHDTAKFYNLDTGVYIARVYFRPGLPYDSLHQVNGNATCFLDSAVIYIAPHTIPEIRAENVTICSGTQLADIPFSISNGFTPYFINIAGYPELVTDSLTGVFPGVPVGNYTMIIHDTCGISTSLSVQVIDSCIDCSTVKAGFNTPDSFACPGEVISLHITDTSLARYRWSINGTFAGDSTSITIAADSNITFIQCIASLYACRDTATAVITVPVTPRFSLGPDTIICEKEDYLLGSGLLSHWSTGVMDSFLLITQPGVYSAWVNGRCTNFADTVKIEWMPCPSVLHIPDAFTPNGDGTNDHFTVFGERIIAYEIRIYNRWGELVYGSNDPTELNDLTRGWDGVYKGALQSTATFVYYMVAQGDDGKAYKEKGNLILIR